MMKLNEDDEAEWRWMKMMKISMNMNEDDGKRWWKLKKNDDKGQSWS